MTPEDALARNWRAMKRTGMLLVATLQPRQSSAPPVVADVMRDQPGAVVIDGIQTLDPSVLYRVADWPSVAAGDRIEVGATIYEVREVLAIDDGLIARAALRRLN